MATANKQQSAFNKPSNRDTLDKQTTIASSFCRCDSFMFCEIPTKTANDCEITFDVCDEIKRIVRAESLGPSSIELSPGEGSVNQGPINLAAFWIFTVPLQKTQLCTECIYFTCIRKRRLHKRSSSY